ncbi:VOC family protein [Haloferax sp. S1W]|uniref:VOC family protein n=1 Tax=Haloferax sp. S1W TaxID=3377110 RepID=UPI0037C6190E
MDPNITVVTLGVSDLDESIRFYRDGLGFPLRDRDPDSDIAFFTLDGTWLALYPWDLLAEDATVPSDATVPPAERGFSGVTIAHNVAEKSEVDAALEEAKAAGGEIVKPAQDVFWGGYSGYFADPDGHLWEVAFPQLTDE